MCGAPFFTLGGKRMGLILLALSLACFVLAALPAAAPHWNRLIAAGLALYVGSLMLGR